jgi:hypothetical protein
VAQLVARLVRNEEARGSNPLSSTAGHQRPFPDWERASELSTGRLRLASWSLTPISWSPSLRIQRLPPIVASSSPTRGVQLTKANTFTGVPEGGWYTGLVELEELTRQSPMFIAAKTGWEGVLDVLPPKAAGTLKQRLSPTAQRVMGQMNRTGSRDGRELGR